MHNGLFGSEKICVCGWLARITVAFLSRWWFLKWDSGAPNETAITGGCWFSAGLQVKFKLASGLEHGKTL